MCECEEMWAVLTVQLLCCWPSQKHLRLHLLCTLPGPCIYKLSSRAIFGQIISNLNMVASLEEIPSLKYKDVWQGICHHFLTGYRKIKSSFEVFLCTIILRSNVILWHPCYIHSLNSDRATFLFMEGQCLNCSEFPCTASHAKYSSKQKYMSLLQLKEKIASLAHGVYGNQ